MDVAAKRDNPGRLEGDDALLFATVQLELELVAFGKRVDVMPELIEVRKLDGRSNRRNQNERRELFADWAIFSPSTGVGLRFTRLHGRSMPLRRARVFHRAS